MANEPMGNFDVRSAKEVMAVSWAVSRTDPYHRVATPAPRGRGYSGTLTLICVATDDGVSCCRLPPKVVMPNPQRKVVARSNDVP